MILATIEFPNGSRINLGEDGRWTGDDEVLVTYANDYKGSAQYYPNPAEGLATEIAAEIGGKVVFAISPRNSGPPDALY